MKFVTFNLRADYGDGADGGNAFCCRQPLIAKVLQAEQPDFVGFQEVLPAAQRWLRAAMPGWVHGARLRARSRSGRRSDDHCGAR